MHDNSTWSATIDLHLAKDKRFMPKRIVFAAEELDQIGTGKPKHIVKVGVESLS